VETLQPNTSYVLLIEASRLNSGIELKKILGLHDDEDDDVIVLYFGGTYCLHHQG
jgi:hypothetical protein